MVKRVARHGCWRGFDVLGLQQLSQMPRHAIDLGEPFCDKKPDLRASLLRGFIVAN